MERKGKIVTRENIRERIFYDLKQPNVVFVDAQDIGGYINPDLLWPLERSEDRKVVIIADNRGDLVEFFAGQGIEISGEGFATLICEKAKVNYRRNDYLTQSEAYRRAKRDIRFCGTTLPYWNSKVEVVDLETGERQEATLIELATSDNLGTVDYLAWLKRKNSEIKAPVIKVGLPQETVVYQSP